MWTRIVLLKKLIQALETDIKYIFEAYLCIFMCSNIPIIQSVDTAGL
jgi:hypothetical protein